MLEWYLFRRFTSIVFNMNPNVVSLHYSPILMGSTEMNYDADHFNAVFGIISLASKFHTGTAFRMNLDVVLVLHHRSVRFCPLKIFFLNVYNLLFYLCYVPRFLQWRKKCLNLSLLKYLERLESKLHNINQKLFKDKLVN